MKLTGQIKEAQILAYKTHLNQVDKSGVPYIYHLMHIAQQMGTETEYIVALLHDIIEDSEHFYNQAFILQEPIPELSKFSKDVKDALIAITRKKNEPYMEYIQRVKENPTARKVKIVNLQHNFVMDLSRLFTDGGRKRLQKDIAALFFLNDDYWSVFDALKNTLPAIDFSDGYAEDRVCIEEENGMWVTYIGSKGRKESEKKFISVVDACLYAIILATGTQDAEDAAKTTFFDALYYYVLLARESEKT